MSNFKKIKKITVLILIIVVSISCLVFSIYGLSQLGSNAQLNSLNTLAVKIFSIRNTKNINYAFGILNYENNDNLILQQTTEDKLINEPIAYLLASISLLKSKDQLSNPVVSIHIPEINIAAPIIHDPDGESSLDKGFWYYPGSDTPNKEIILYCHRRYWGKKHPYSCWYLDRLGVNSNLQLNRENNSLDQYTVVSINTYAKDDPQIMISSGVDTLKIITCAPLGFSTHRLVVVAKKI